jgi:starch phosphorylase
VAVARYLVQGVDVWLNTPLRPLEASGTSGMKAAANGVLNLSTLDGWWDEVWRDPYRPDGIGWAIGAGENYADRQYQDEVEAEALYELIERDVIPTFYERGADRVPRKWVSRMKASIGTLAHFVNTHRMVSQYTRDYYLDAHARYRKLDAGNGAGARTLAAWIARVEKEWPRVAVERMTDGSSQTLPVGTKMRVRARVELGGLTPDDVAVELYWGRIDAKGEIAEAATAQMQFAGRDGGKYVFEAAAVPCARSGLHGYTVRVLPHHPDLASPMLPGLIAWADGDKAGAQVAR